MNGPGLFLRSYCPERKHVYGCRNLNPHRPQRPGCRCGWITPYTMGTRAVKRRGSAGPRPLTPERIWALTAAAHAVNPRAEESTRSRKETEPRVALPRRSNLPSRRGGRCLASPPLQSAFGASAGSIPITVRMVILMRVQMGSGLVLYRTRGRSRV